MGIVQIPHARGHQGIRMKGEALQTAFLVGRRYVRVEANGGAMRGTETGTWKRCRNEITEKNKEMKGKGRRGGAGKGKQGKGGKGETGK